MGVRMRCISTALVEQSALFREGLGCILANSGFSVTTRVSRPEDLLSDEASEPELTLFGSHCNDINFLKNIACIRESFQNTRIVVLSEGFEYPMVFDALRLSVCGCLSKSIDTQTLIKSLELIMLGECVIPSEVLIDLVRPTCVDERPTGAHEREPLPSPLKDSIISNPHSNISNPHSNLSHREVEILQLLVCGQSNKEIARHLNIVEATVKVHIKAILRKVRVNNRTQAAMWAVAHQEGGSWHALSGSSVAANSDFAPLTAPAHLK